MAETKLMKQNGILLKTVGKAEFAAMVVIALGCMLLTTFAISGSMDETGCNYGTITILSIGALCGALLIRRSNINRKWLVVLLYASMTVGGLFIINIIVFNRVFADAPIKIIAVNLGSFVGLLGSWRGRGKKRKFTRGKLYKSHNR